MAKRGDPTKHVGFRQAAKEAAEGEGEDYKHGAAMIAASNRKASPAAKRKNPRLKRVKGA